MGSGRGGGKEDDTHTHTHTQGTIIMTFYSPSHKVRYFAYSTSKMFAFVFCKVCEQPSCKKW